MQICELHRTAHTARTSCTRRRPLLKHSTAVTWFFVAVLIKTWCSLRSYFSIWSFVLESPASTTRSNASCAHARACVHTRNRRGCTSGLCIHTLVYTQLCIHKRSAYIIVYTYACVYTSEGCVYTQVGGVCVCVCGGGGGGGGGGGHATCTDIVVNSCSLNNVVHGTPRSSRAFTRFFTASSPVNAPLTCSSEVSIYRCACFACSSA